MKIQVVGLISHKAERIEVCDLIAEGETLQELLDSAQYVFVDGNGHISKTIVANDERAETLIGSKWYIQFNHTDKSLIDILKYTRATIVALLIDTESDHHKRQILSNLIHQLTVVIEKHDKKERK